MKHWKIRLFTLTLVLITAFLLATPAFAEAPAADLVTVLFTSDLHSHLLPAAESGGEGEYGGYARLMTVIKEQKAMYPDALLVDGGDFSMGSLFQTAYTSSAIELRMMGAMGYDATTFGNHEFDYLPKGLAAMLNVAASCGEPVPQIVDANYLPPQGDEAALSEDASLVWEAFENYGVQEYILLERGGVPFVVFGIVGYDSDDCAPNSGMILEEPMVAAQRTVDAAVADCLEQYGREPFVICLSHSGTEDGKGEDYELAKEVEGIDLIISGHTHTELQEPILVGDTIIGSAWEYGRALGVLRVEFSESGDAELISYELIPVDENVPEDPEIAELVELFKGDVEENYLKDYNMSFDQILVDNPYKFDTVDEVYDTPHESTLGNLFSDAYKWAVERTTGESVDMAVTAAGVIRETMPQGQVSVSDVFNAASLGVGTEGELIQVYITGQDLKNALEVDASVQPLMSSAQLFPSGVEYSFNRYRMLFNKVDYAMLRRDDGTLEVIQDDKLYKVVTGMYAGQMLGSVEETSFGLIAITPRDEYGNPLTADQLVDYVVKDENGVPLKEWYAIAAYLQQMGGEMDEAYSAVDGRKVVYSSLNPVKLLKNANKFTFVLLVLILVVIVVIILVVRRRKRHDKQGRKHRVSKKRT